MMYEAEEVPAPTDEVLAARFNNQVALLTNIRDGVMRGDYEFMLGEAQFSSWLKKAGASTDRATNSALLNIADSQVIPVRKKEADKNAKTKPTAPKKRFFGMF